jgi:hypothetical protein
MPQRQKSQNPTTEIVCGKIGFQPDSADKVPACRFAAINGQDASRPRQAGCLSSN